MTGRQFSTAAPEFLTAAPRHLFFTGKGGVGKTSLACASAVFLADLGRRVLIVSTDPASNLDAVLETHLANTPTKVAEVPNLDAMNIDPEQAARDYKERTIAPYRNALPPNEIALLEERLSGACTVEVAAFDEFALTSMAILRWRSAARTPRASGPGRASAERTWWKSACAARPRTFTAAEKGGFISTTDGAISSASQSSMLAASCVLNRNCAQQWLPNRALLSEETVQFLAL